MNQQTDEQLFARYRAGEREAFALLVKRYEKELFNFLAKFLGKKSLAEEVFQEAFLQVHLSADRFDSGRRFRPWLYTIAANKARDLLRSRDRKQTVQLTAQDPDDGTLANLWDSLLRDEQTAEDIFEAEQTRKEVRNIITGMPDMLREILVLAYFGQLSYKEMAEILKIPLGTVKSRLHSAVSNFAQRYQEAQKQQDK